MPLAIREEGSAWRSHILRYRRISNESAANTALTVTTATISPGQGLRLLYVTVSYSAVPVQTGIIITHDSGIGAAHDIELFGGAANAQTALFFPGDGTLSGDHIILDDDVISVLAPAAGGVITSAIAIYVESL